MGGYFPQFARTLSYPYSLLSRKACQTLVKFSNSSSEPRGPDMTHPRPQFGQLGPLFYGRQNSRFKSHLGGGEGDILKPKKQLKVQYIGIFEEIDSFY